MSEDGVWQLHAHPCMPQRHAVPQLVDHRAEAGKVKHVCAPDGSLPPVPTPAVKVPSNAPKVPAILLACSRGDEDNLTRRRG